MSWWYKQSLSLGWRPYRLQIAHVIAVIAVIVTPRVQCAALDGGVTSLIMSSWIFVTPLSSRQKDSLFYSLYLKDRYLKNIYLKKYVKCALHMLFFISKTNQFYQAYSERTRRNGSLPRWGRFRLEIRKVFSLSEWSGIWICFPEKKWRSDHPWRSLRGFWIWS